MFPPGFPFFWGFFGKKKVEKIFGGNPSFKKFLKKLAGGPKEQCPPGKIKIPWFFFPKYFKLNSPVFFEKKEFFFWKLKKRPGKRNQERLEDLFWGGGGFFFFFNPLGEKIKSFPPQKIHLDFKNI